MIRKIFITLNFVLLTLIIYSQELPANLQLVDLQGQRTRIDSIIGTKTTIILFWASWCKPCLSELEALNDLKEEWQDKVTIVAISIDDARATTKVRSIVRGKKWPFLIYLDSNQELYKRLNLTSIPCALVVRNGTISWKHYGYMPGNENELLEKAYQDK